MDKLITLVDVNLLGERLRVLFADAIKAGEQGRTGDYSDAGYASKALQVIDDSLADTPTV